MSHTGVLEMNVSAKDAYTTLKHMMMDLDATVTHQSDEHLELTVKSAPSLWTYGFNFECLIEPTSDASSRLTVNTALRKWSLIDTQSKRYTNRLLTIMEAYTSRNTDAFDNKKFQKAFKSVRGHRGSFYMGITVLIVLLALLKITLHSR